MPHGRQKRQHLPRLLVLPLLFLFLSFFAKVQAQVRFLSVDRVCADPQGTVTASFAIQGDANGRSWYWIGIYPEQDITPDRVRTGEAFLRGEPELWVSGTSPGEKEKERKNQAEYI